MFRDMETEIKVLDVAWVGLLVAVGLVVGCGTTTEIRHYQMKVAKKAVERSDAPSSTDKDVALAVENFSAGPAYDGARMAYKEDPYRLDYYHFHRWAASPGLIVADVLRDTYRMSEAFESVTSGYAARADVVLTGRVLALEEIDVNENKWVGHVSVDLRLRNAATGQMIWSKTVRKRRKLKEQSPPGLAQAISRLLTEIGMETIDDILKAAEQNVRQKAPRIDLDQSGADSSGESKEESTSGSSEDSSDQSEASSDQSEGSSGQSESTSSDASGDEE